jgi:hypothetical protein
MNGAGLVRRLFALSSVTLLMTVWGAAGFAADNAAAAVPFP